MLRTFYILLFFLFSSCSPTWRRNLTIPQVDYMGTELQTDGFYYNKKFETFILYKNGIYLIKYSVGEVLSSVEDVLRFWQA
jgi:hypothetical protein